VENQDYNPVTGEPKANAGAVDLAGKTQVLGLDYKTAGILCYLPICLVNLISSLVFINSEPADNRYLRLHAMQSLVMTVVMMVVCIGSAILSMVLGFIPVLGMVLGLILNLASMGVGLFFLWQCIRGIIACSKGETLTIPYITQIAEERLAQ
jgi:uncharacterized membrane protein